MRAVVMVLRGRFRQYWRSWLVLCGLVAVAGGSVLAATAAGSRTAAAFPGFTSRHGYDVILYSGNRLPPLRQLPRVVSLLSGRMPHQSDPSEVLASFTLAQHNGVRVGSVLRPQLASPAQLRGGPGDPSPALRPVLHVVGIVAAESEFPSGASPHYNLYATTALATAVNRHAALLWTYYVGFSNGATGLADSDSRFRSLGIYGRSDLDEAADAVQSSVRPQVTGWYVLAALAALAALAVIGQAMARQTAAAAPHSAPRAPHFTPDPHLTPRTRPAPHTSRPRPRPRPRPDSVEKLFRAVEE